MVFVVKLSLTHSNTVTHYIINKCGKFVRSTRNSENTNHCLCGSNKLLYKRCAKSMGRPKFRPPQLPHFQPILMKLETKKDIRNTTPHAQFGWCGTTGRGFLLTLTGHSRRPITTVYGSKRVFPRKVGPFGDLDDKKR